MRGVRWLLGVLLVFVMLGSVVSPVLAMPTKQALEQMPVSQQKIWLPVIIATPTITTIEDNKTIKNISSKMLRNANNLITKVEKSMGCKLIPLYNKAKLYYTTLKGLKTIVGKIPLKSDKPALFIFAKNKLRTVTVVEVVDSNRITYYVMDNKCQYVKTVSVPIRERTSRNTELEQVTPLWISDPEAGGTHEIITYYSALGMGLSKDVANTLAEHSGDPDRYDSGIDRYIKHAYDPILNIGGAPDACNKNVTDAINSFSNGDYTNGYIHLAHALHYLEDVGNPYHTWLEPDGLFHNYVNHIYYENLVYKQGPLWNLHYICAHAQKHSVSSPKSAVKSLAWYSRSKAEVLDLWVSIYRVTGWGYALDNIKGITQDVVKETAGYVKGLIDYTVP